MKFKILNPIMLIVTVSCFAVFFQALGTVAVAQESNVNISTSGINGWTVTAAGAVNATPFPFGSELSISSTGTGVGDFVPGGSWSEFDGFWTAQYLFFLPKDASDISLNFNDLYADDRVVLNLNGTTIGSAGIAYQGDAIDGSIVLTEGGPLIPYTFDGASGTVSRSVTGGFVLGETNILLAIVNNTGTGVYGPLNPIYQGTSNDGTHFGLSGSIIYSVPEPSSHIILVVGVIVIFLGRNVLHRQKPTMTTATTPWL